MEGQDQQISASPEARIEAIRHAYAWDMENFRLRERSYGKFIRALLFMNGVGAAALLVFLQAVWPKWPGLSWAIVVGLIPLALGVAMAGATELFRYHASFALHRRRDRNAFNGWRRTYLWLGGRSAVAFVLGIAVVVVGALAEF